MSDGLKSHIRTGWPIFIGFLATLAVDFLASRMGISIDGEVAFLAVGTIVTLLVYSLGRWLETRPWPLAARLGRVILSLGLDVGTPTYSRDASTPPTPRTFVVPPS